MGMSSSQARLLNLTSRMHQIEYKAAKLEAEKLQMANESRRAYEDYLFVKEQTNVQVGMLTEDGSKTYVNTTLAMLEGRTDYKLANSLYLQDVESGKIMVSKATQEKYNLGNSGAVGDLQSFMNAAGLSKSVVEYSYLGNSTKPAEYVPVSTNVQAGVTRTVPNIDPSVGYHAVSHQSIPAGAIAVSSVTDNFDSSKTYVINTKEDLIALQDLTNSGKSTQGVHFVLGGNIDMSGVAWNGIGTSSNAFKGIFDGNGYTISNITSTNAGLFKYITGDRNPSTNAVNYGIVKNVKVTGLNVTGNGVGEKGGIAGVATNAYLENCYTDGSIQGANWSAGMIGHNKGSAVINSTANVNVATTGSCVGGFIGHDSSGYLVNCVSYGSVSGSGWVGGLIGHEQSSGQGRIEKCSTLTTVTSGDPSKAGAFIGVIDNGCSVNVVNSSYSSAAGAPCGSAPANAFQSTGSEAGLAGTATREVITTKINVPNQLTFKSNVAMMLDKSGVAVDADFQTKLDAWLAQFYETDDNFTDGALVKDSLKLASINDAVADYLRNGSNPAIVTSLISDINNNSLTATTSYQNKYVETKDYEYSPFVSTTTAVASKQFPVETPSLQNISNNLYTALHANRFPNAEWAADVATVLAWVQNNYNNGTNASDKLALANLNAYLEKVQNGNADLTELTKINNAIVSNGTYSMPATAQTYVANPSTSTSYYVKTMTHDENQTKTEEYNMNLPEIAEAVNLHAILESNGYVVIDDEQANSNKWLTNTINAGKAVLIEAGTTEVESFETSVSRNTSLREVADETMLKRAEAEYEASMLKIDKKDRKYDTDLAALETERNAIKQEMETLKTVAKDNVDRTFKLFS